MTAAPATAPAHDDRWYLAAAPLWRSLVHLAVPMMAAISVGVVYGIINAGFIGSLHQTVLLSAITFGLPVFVLQMAVGGVFGVGASTAIGRLLGASDEDPGARDEIRRFSAFGFWGALGAGVVVGGICLLLLGPIVTLLGADPASRAATTQYVAVMLAFTPVLVAAFALEQFVRAEGAARISLIGIVASTIANLVFDVLFILVLHWGVAGAALAVGLSNVVTVAWFVWWIERRSTSMSLAIRWFRPSARIAREVFGIGLSELLQSSFLLVTGLVLNNVAVAYGDGVLAAFGVALRIVQFPEFLAMGVFLGALPLFAFAYGRRDLARLRGAISRSAIAILVLILVFATPVFLLRDQVFQLFSDSRSVTGVGVLILTAMLVSALVNGFTGLVMAVFQATGQALAATVMGIAQGVVFVPVVLVANATLGLPGVIWSNTVAEVLAFLLGGALFLARRRHVLAPTEAEAQAAQAAAEVPA